MSVDMRDRLGQLRHAQQQSPHGDLIVEETNIGGGGEEFLGNFFSTVEDITQTMHKIIQHSDEIKNNQNKILASVQNKEAKESIDELMNEVKKLSHRVHNGLKRLKGEVDEEEKGPNRDTADFRIKKAQVSTLTRKFTEVMAEYNQVQEDYRQKSKDRIQRQLKYTGKRVTDDQVEEMLESDNVNVFTQDIIIDTAQMRQALGEIEARHQEIIQLEENIKELHQMFYDMALLVEEQGEMINQIEFNVENAAIHVEQGRVQVGEAVTYHRKNTRLKWIICGVVTGFITVLLIVILIVALSVVCGTFSLCK